MKKLTILIAAVLISTLAIAKDGMKQFYAQHRSDRNVTHINLPKLLLRFAGDDAETRTLLRPVRSLRIFEMEGAKHTRAGIQHELDKALAVDGYESILQVTEEQERVNIYICQDKRYVRRVLICVDNNEELVLLQANTKISFDKMSALVSDYKAGKKPRFKK